jgi:large subunit ribosomal protein L7/L12
MSEEKEIIEVPEKFQDLVKKIENLSALDLSELVRVLEKKFGVSAAAPMAIMAGGNAGGGDEAGSAVAEKTSFNIELSAAGDQKINVIKVVREITGLGLKEAKDLVDAAPKTIKEGVKKEEAEEMRSKLTAVGATVEIK